MILFLWVPRFYASIEQADAQAFGCPILVGGDPAKGATVVSASVEASRAGVTEGMFMEEALGRCPQARLVPTRLPRYREVTAEIRAILRDATEHMEPAGGDSAYLAPRAAQDALTLAAELCVRVKAELGLEMLAGIGATKFVAYLAAHHSVGEAIHYVARENTLDFIGALPVTEIWGLGPATGEKLAARGITRIADLRRHPREQLAELVGRRNVSEFLALANGRDSAHVQPSPRPKSLSRERTLPECCHDLHQLQGEIGLLANHLEAMLSRERSAARRVTLSIGYADGDRCSRTSTLPQGIVHGGDIHECALELLSRTQAGMRSVRRLSLQVSRLGRRDGRAGASQIRLF